MPPLLRARALALSLGLMLAASGCQAHAARSVLLVVVDTLRADHLGVYGYDRPARIWMCGQRVAPSSTRRLGRLRGLCFRSRRSLRVGFHPGIWPASSTVDLMVTRLTGANSSSWTPRFQR